MPGLYTWECDGCKHLTEVMRAFALYDRPPEDGCEKCAKPLTRRVIQRPTQVKGFVLEGSGWTDTIYWGPNVRQGN